MLRLCLHVCLPATLSVCLPPFIFTTLPLYLFTLCIPICLAVWRLSDDYRGSCD